MFEVIDVSSGSGASSTTGRFGWPWAVAAIAVVGLLGWMLTRSSDDAGQVEQSLEQDEESDAQTTTTRPRSTTIWRPPATTTYVSPAFVEAEGVAPGEPLLGEPVGLTLFVGGRTLLAIDLDTGGLAEHEVSDSPMLATDEWLMFRDNNGLIVVRPRADLTASPRELSDDGWFRTATMDGPDHVWVIEYSDLDQTQRWESVSLADGSARTVLEEVAFSGGSGEPVVASTVSGGVFVLNDDRQSYRRIADGFPIAAAERLVLVRSCETPITSSCRLFWVDRDSGDEVDRFVPPLNPFWWGVWSSPSGGLLIVESDVGVTLWDVERSTEVDTVPNGQSGSPVAFSPDGRFAAYQGSTSALLIVYDSLDGTKHEIATPGNGITVNGLAFGRTAGAGTGE